MKGMDLNNEKIDHLSVQVEVPVEYQQCRNCMDGDCKECKTIKEKKLDETMANWLRPRMPFPSL